MLKLALYKKINIIVINDWQLTYIGASKTPVETGSCRSVI